ncbi:MAG: hypothetical protein KF791_00535 [Verrucomicrobiae bacterium]|nr:hypothetical protein [Verrucomicrobiae bacterium]
MKPRSLHLHLTTGLALAGTLFTACYSSRPGDPRAVPSPEIPTRRIILQASFDTGAKDPDWPGDFLLAAHPPAGATGRAARSVPRPGDGAAMIVLPIAPPHPVGADTRLRFRHHLTGASAITVQIFDATVQDNRHIRLETLEQGRWVTTELDFTRDSRRNDGSPDRAFPAGNLVDDLFFFVEGPGSGSAVLFLDDVVLFDVGTP